MMKGTVALWVVAVLLIIGVSTRELTEEDFYNYFPGHLEYDPDFRRLYPNIPGPSSDAEPYIVGGEEAVPNSRPYQGAMLIPFNSGNAFCGASLINARTALTAAHCVENRVGNVSITFGGHNFPATNDPHAYQVSSGDVLLHPNWTRAGLLNDIALVRFHEPVPLSAYIRPVLLPSNADQDYLGNTTLVSGWGRPSDSVNSISPVLREVTSFVISNFACRLAYLGVVVDSTICISGSRGRGTCNGDSGGPLVVNGVQIGVVSFGSGWGCEQGWPSGLARVTSFLDWINENMATV